MDPDCPTQLKTRRVIARIEASPHGYDLRCIVTSTKTAPAILYESIYCQRGEAENLIKLHKLHKTQLASDRTSCETPEANQFRLILHTLAYWTMITLREAIPEGMPERRPQFETLRGKLIKVAARVVELNAPPTGVGGISVFGSTFERALNHHLRKMLTGINNSVNLQEGIGKVNFPNPLLKILFKI